MNKQELLNSVAKAVQQKHPWYISQDKYIALFGELPKEFLAERAYYDLLAAKAKQFKVCQLILSQVKIDVKLTLDELIVWELNLDKVVEESKAHNILPGDIKKILKSMV